METYSNFTSSTNSTSSSNNIFPFSLGHMLTDDHLNAFDTYYDHHHHDHHSGNQYETCIELEVPRVIQSHPLTDDYKNKQDGDDDDGDCLEKRMVMVNKSDSSNIKGKNNKGLSSSTKKKIKKHRYAFQTRSHVDILDDGYRWRKYGQKAVKNNNFPRSYYRCTHQGCNVKKQVQRLSKDEGVVVTTYEGMHSHSIHTPTDNFEHILSQMQIYTSF